MRLSMFKNFYKTTQQNFVYLTWQNSTKYKKYLCLGEMAIVGEMTTIFLGCGGNANLGVGELTT